LLTVLNISAYANSARLLPHPGALALGAFLFSRPEIASGIAILCLTLGRRNGKVDYFPSSEERQYIQLFENKLSVVS
jgi:hypothetical protein